MALTNWAYIFLSTDFSPSINLMVSKSRTSQFKAIGMDPSQKEMVIEIAKKLVMEGTQLIELCGGFGSLWATKVSEAINYEIPVGSTVYGAKASLQVLEIVRCN